MDFQQNDRVRVKTSPDRVGRLTGKVKEHAGRRRYQVDFGASLEYVIEGNLEAVAEEVDEFDLLEKGHYGGVINLRFALTHTRLTGRLADVIYSMEASNTEFFPYQFKPVLNFLDSPSRGILVADEVGLGKTIEAGLIWTELRARFDANRLLVLCPAVLREKWQEELAHRFGVRAEICGAKDLQRLLDEQNRGVIDGFAAIASFQGIRPPKGWKDKPSSGVGALSLAHRLDAEVLGDPLFDCVVVDEAHYLRNPSRQTHELGKLVRGVADNIVLLSATPIQLHSDDLFYLLSIIDAENFQYVEAFRSVLEANRPLVTLAGQLRRSILKSSELVDELNICLSHPLLQDNRQLDYIRSNPPSDDDLTDPVQREQLATRIERINLLARVVNRTRKRDVHQNRVVRNPLAPHVAMNAMETHFYTEVTNVVRQYCLDRDLIEGFILTIPQRQMCSSMPAALRAWQKKLDALSDENLWFESGAEESKREDRKSIGPLVSALANAVGGIATYEQLKASDSKYRVLVDELKGYWERYPKQKVIIFSFYRETLGYLHERLQEDGIPSVVLMGGIKEPKHEVIKRFQNDPSTQVLLASEVASEGVDLQFSSFLINYDLPWNPMRVEQRIGRIDRIGQKQDRILILNFFYEGSLDDRIYNRLFLRLDIFQNALGDIEPILGQKINELTYELLSHKLSPEEEAERIDQTSLAIAGQKRAMEELEAEAAHLAAHGDYVLNKVKAAREMRRFIDGESLWIYVRDALGMQFPGTELIRVNDEPLTAEISLSQEAKAEFRYFLDQTKGAARTKLLSNYSGKRATCIFSNQVDFSYQQYEVVNQYHPLVRFVISRVASEKFHPLAAATVSPYEVPGMSPGSYLVAAQLWSTRGARVIEKLVFRGVRLENGEPIDADAAERLLNGAVRDGQDWPAAKSKWSGDRAVHAYQDVLDQLDDEFEGYVTLMEFENADRIDFLVKSASDRIQAQILRIQETIAQQTARGYLDMLKANEGRVSSLRETLDDRLGLFEKQRQVHTDQQTVTRAVIHVEA